MEYWLRTMSSRVLDFLAATSEVKKKKKKSVSRPCAAEGCQRLAASVPAGLRCVVSGSWEPSDLSTCSFCFLSVFLLWERRHVPAPKASQHEKLHCPTPTNKERKSRLKVRCLAPLSGFDAHVTQRAPGPAVTWGRVRHTQEEAACPACAPERLPPTLQPGGRGSGGGIPRWRPVRVRSEQLSPSAEQVFQRSQNPPGRPHSHPSHSGGVWASARGAGNRFSVRAERDGWRPQPIFAGQRHGPGRPAVHCRQLGGRRRP